MSRQEDIEILRSLGLGTLVHALKHNWIGSRILEAMEQARDRERAQMSLAATQQSGPAGASVPEMALHSQSIPGTADCALDQSRLDDKLKARGYNLDELERDNPHNAWMREQ